MRSSGKLVAVGLTVAIAFLVVWFLRDRGKINPEISAIEALDPFASPCSERSERRVFQLDLTGGQVDADVLTRFGIEKGWGVNENTSVVQSPDGEGNALLVVYAAGVTSPTTQSVPVAGASFYAPAGLGNGETSACLRYSVFFPESFDFVRGGKLPGLFGGDRPPSGGARPSGDDGFTLRLMWRKQGEGELYAYFPNMIPDSDRGGDQIGTGFWRFNKGIWTEIEMEAELNDPGESNGLVRIWVNGTPRLFVRNIKFRITHKLGIDGLVFSTFFGGQSARFAPATDQAAYFKDIQMFR